MCGIAGFIDNSSNKKNYKNQIIDMIQSLHLRGPDEKGYFLYKNLAIAIARLDIIDLKTGSQPIFNEDKSLVVVFNGEIYNFRELRLELQSKNHKFYTNSDTEVLVHLYEEYKENMCFKLNGMFAFAIYNKNDNSVYIARDRIGIKPLYYYYDKKNFAFASELKAFLKLPFFKKNLDSQALAQYLIMEYIPAPKAIFKNIYKLLPGHYLIIKNNKVVIRQYWDVPKTKIKYNNFNEIKEHFISLVDDSVKRRLISDVPIGVFLSGGIDSSTISHFAYQYLKKNLHTFSISFDNPSFDETRYINLMRNKLDIHHHDKLFNLNKMLPLIPKVFQYLDEPFADASILPTYMLSQFARKNITVALGGDGGDELFAGYPTYPAHKFALLYSRLPLQMRNFINKQLNRLPVSLKNFSIDFKIKKFISGINYPPLIRNFIWLGSYNEKELLQIFSPNMHQEIKNFNPFDIIDENIKNFSEENVLDQILYLDLKLYLQNDILVKVDRASMANSLEVRVPFLDYRIVEFIYTLPLEYKLNFFQTKYILKQSMKKILPRQIIQREKKGFGIPIAHWIKHELKDFTLNLLSKENIIKHDIFNYSFIQNLLNEHFNGIKDNRKKIWTLIAFQLWQKYYFS